MKCLKRKFKNLWNFVCMLIAMLLVRILWTPLLLMLWKILSLGKLVFMKMIFLVPQLWKIAILLHMMIPNLPYMMITMMNMIFSVHLLLRKKLIMIIIRLLYLMIMVMGIIMVAILFNLLP